MIISWKWLSDFVDLKGQKPEKVADRLTHLGLEVEEVKFLAEGFDDVVVAKILEKKQHPNADRLSLCKVNAGGQKVLDIVCGATNMKTGDLVALAQVGAVLPNGMKIQKSKIRGEESSGMLCSEAELGLAEESPGIMILPEGEKLGRKVADVLGRDDFVFDIGITPNRGDCLNHIGVAREVAAALGRKIKLPKVKKLPSKKSPIKTRLSAGADCPQFLGCLIEGVEVGPSPAWLVSRLEAIGQRSINNVVDATNYVLNELGQPTHAYDADLLDGKVLSARRAKPGEKLKLLDETEVSLKGTELVIADASRPVALAGVMGGLDTSVNESTKRVFLECAQFSPIQVRRASQGHQKITDSCQRFEKGIDAEGLPFALTRLASLIQEIAGGKAVGVHFERKVSRVQRTISFDPRLIENFIGVKIPLPKIEKILSALNCKVRKGKVWKVSPPSYRLDLNIPEDLAEEVARTVGYENLPSTLPPLTTMPRVEEGDEGRNFYELTERARDAMTRQGFLETVQFAFNRTDTMKNLGFEPTVKIVNPMSDDHEIMIPSLIPGLLQQAKENANHHFGSDPLALRLFELRPTFHASGEVRADGKTGTGIQEIWKLAMILSGPRHAAGLAADMKDADYYDLKSAVENLFESMGARGLRLGSNAASQSFSHLIHPGKSATILSGKNEIGFLGRLHPRVAQKWKLKFPVWIAEIDWQSLAERCRSWKAAQKFRGWSEFPGIERDFSLVLQKGVESERITQIAVKTGRPLAKVAKIFDIYEGPQVPEGMTSVSVRVIFSTEGRSLKEAEADEISARILQKWKSELGAELRN